MFPTTLLDWNTFSGNLHATNASAVTNEKKQVMSSTFPRNRKNSEIRHHPCLVPLLESRKIPGWINPACPDIHTLQWQYPNRHFVKIPPRPSTGFGKFIPHSMINLIQETDAGHPSFLYQSVGDESLILDKKFLNVVGPG